MSGVEVVGLVLGVLPLVIQAVNWYHQGVKPMKEYWNYGPTLQLLQDRLDFQAILYEDSIRRLLILSGVSDCEIHILLDSSEPWQVSEAWNKDQLTDKIRNTLGARHFDSFKSNVQQMEKLVEGLMAGLKLDTKGKPKCIPDGIPLHSTSMKTFQPRLEHEWRKIVRTFSMKKQEKLIEEFKEYNGAIAAFVLNKEILAPQGPSGNTADSKSLVKYFDLVRKEACNLYGILEKNLKCSCNDPHNANLQLSFRKIEGSAPVFKVCFFSTSAKDDLKSWRRTCIHPSPRTQAIEDNHYELLCNVLCTDSQCQVADGIIWTSPDWKIVAETDGLFSSQTSNIRHLRSLLEKDQTRSKRSSRFKGLTEKQRRQIAVALSYSVLQFYDSPWMHDLWGEEDIYFFTGVNQFKRLEISDPSFSCTFPKQQIRESEGRQLETQFIDVHMPSKPLFALGIVLLELCLDMTFGELHDISSNETDKPLGAIEKYQIVMENLDNVYDQWGETFGQVVQRCLNPGFGLRPSETRMDFDKFRCRVYEDIVVPLEYNLSLFI